MLGRDIKKLLTSCIFFSFPSQTKVCVRGTRKMDWIFSKKRIPTFLPWWKLSAAKTNCLKRLKIIKDITSTGSPEEERAPKKVMLELGKFLFSAVFSLAGALLSSDNLYPIFLQLFLQREATDGFVRNGQWQIWQRWKGLDRRVWEIPSKWISIVRARIV